MPNAVSSTLFLIVVRLGALAWASANAIGRVLVPLLARCLAGRKCYVSPWQLSMMGPANAIPLFMCIGRLPDRHGSGALVPLGHPALRKPWSELLLRHMFLVLTWLSLVRHVVLALVLFPRFPMAGPRNGPPDVVSLTLLHPPAPHMLEMAQLFRGVTSTSLRSLCLALAPGNVMAEVPGVLIPLESPAMESVPSLARLQHLSTALPIPIQLLTRRLPMPPELHMNRLLDVPRPVRLTVFLAVGARTAQLPNLLLGQVVAIMFAAAMAPLMYGSALAAFRTRVTLVLLAG